MRTLCIIPLIIAASIQAINQPIIVNITTSHRHTVIAAPYLPNLEQLQEVAQKAQAYKWPIVAVLAGSAYLALIMYIQKAQWLIGNAQSWCNWQHNVSLEQLSKLEQEELYAQIKKTFEERYIDQKPNTLMLLARFFNETNDELTTLHRYLNITQTLNSCWLARLFLVKNQGMTAAHEGIRRLTFIRSILATELEPHDTVRRMYLINSPSLGYQV